MTSPPVSIGSAVGRVAPGWSVRSVGPAAVAVLAAISPFDLALPAEGWTDLHLRPLLVASAVLALVALASSAHRTGPGRGPGSVLIAALPTLGFAAASMASPDPATGFAVTVRIAVLTLIFLAAAAAVGGPEGRRWLVAGVAAGVGTSAVVGLVVLGAGGDLLGTGSLLGSISTSRGVVRLTRPFSHANVAAMYLAPAVVLVAAGAGWVRSRLWSTVLVGVALLGAVALSLTLGRAGVGALIGSAIGWAMVDRSGRRRALSLVAVVVVVGLLSGRWVSRLDPSAPGPGPRPIDRLTIWGQAVDAFLGSPLTGIGPGRFGVHSRALTPAGEAAAAHAHQPLLEAIATGGLVAATGVVAFVLVLAIRAAPGAATVSAGLSAAGAAAILPMVVDDPLLFSSSGNLIALVTGAWYGAAREAGPGSGYGAAREAGPGSGYGAAREAGPGSGYGAAREAGPGVLPAREVGA